MDERNQVIYGAVKDMLARGNEDQAIRTLTDLHSADAAEILSHLEIDEEVQVIKSMDIRAAALALLEMEESHQVEIAAELKATELMELLEQMPTDEAVDLLGDVPEAQRLTLLRLFGGEEAREFKELLAYGDQTAGGLMTPEFVSVSPETNVDEVIELMRSVPPEVETIYYVYVVSKEGSLEGVLSLRELILSSSSRKVEEIMERDVIAVNPADDQEEVAEAISKYDLLAVPVLDGSGHMMGIVTVDDVMDVIDDEAEEDILKFAGALVVEEEAPDGLWANLGRRIPWFVVAVIVEILIVGGIIKLYSPVLSKFVVLVFFIPLLVVMGGNIAVQSAAIVGHWLATGTPMQRTTIKAMGAEILWGVLVGLLAGAAVAALSFAFHLGTSVGVVVGLSLALSILAAALIGCGLPFTMKALGRDASSVSGPLLGTTMDVISLAIYLAIGRLLIGG